MQHWVTTHWPRREDESDAEPPSGVWVQDGKKDLIDQLAPGDQVFIYEAKTGPTVTREYTDGTKKQLRCRQGRVGIVAHVEVTDRAYQPADAFPEQYPDGSTKWWRYCAPTKSVNSAGFLPRAYAATLLGFSDRFPFRGLGERHSGLKKISADTFNAIKEAFIASAGPTPEWPLGQTNSMNFGGGGEGPEHQALKTRIASDPAALLQEAGLKHVKTEWPFQTGDRVDLVLQDGNGRFVCVEVEVDCDDTEVAGPLQCMKYRAMLAYIQNRRVEEVRTILVAHSIHPAVVKTCAKYGIECKVVARQSTAVAY